MMIEEREEEMTHQDSYCTLCGFDFDGPELERICSHPLLPVPICDVCLEEFELPDHSSECQWCGDGGDLLICDQCEGSICEGCIQDNLGSEKLREIRELDTWQCFVCDPRPLDCFQGALLKSESDYFPTTIELTASLLDTVEDEILRCQTFQENEDALVPILSSIEVECEQEGKSKSDFQEEIVEWKKRWERHWERMCLRSASLQDHFQTLGGDLAVFYQKRVVNIEQCDKTLEQLQSDHNFEEKEEPTRPSSFVEYLLQLPQSNPPSVNPTPKESRAHVSTFDSFEIEAIEPIPATVEIRDEIVMKFSAQPDPPKEAFPIAFLQFIPYDVLKALYYAKLFSPDRDYLVKRFSVPPEIQIVLSYSRYEATQDGFNESYWPSLTHLHPAVRKALYHASPAEISLLAGKFGVPFHVQEIEETEVGEDTDEDENNFSTSNRKALQNSVSAEYVSHLATIEDRERRCEFEARQLLPPTLIRWTEEEDSLEDQISVSFRSKRSISHDGSPLPSKRSKKDLNSRDDPLKTLQIQRKDIKDNDLHLEIIDCESLILNGNVGTNENPIVLDTDSECDEAFPTSHNLNTPKTSKMSSSNRKNTKNEWAPIFPSLRGETAKEDDAIDENPFCINGSSEINVIMKKSLSQKLMSHQKEAVEFLWKNTMQGTLPTNVNPGAGCILAHCMGSGKTLSTLSFLITLLSNSSLKAIIDPLTNRPLIYQVLIICPVNVLDNWEVEFNKWVPRDCSISCYKIDTNMKRENRLTVLQAWQRRGGICILGKEMFCSLVEDNGKGKDDTKVQQPVDKIRQLYYSSLVTPGPDLVVVDEAHHVKNASGRLYNNLKDLRTNRRISLTGSPIQNNLRELWAMVEFVKPGHFPKWERFYNLFVRPIEDGGTKDATSLQISQMKKKTYKLNSLLSGIMLRRSADKLTTDLTPKLEFVIFLRLTPFQRFLYRRCMDRILQEKGRYLFKACKRGSRVWNHPACLPLNIRSEFEQQHPRRKLEKISKMLKPSYQEFQQFQESQGSLDHDTSLDLIVQENEITDPTEFDEEEDTSGDVDDWWKKFPSQADSDPMSDSDLLALGNKIIMFLSLLSHSISVGDKVLLFSQSLSTLDFLEIILQLNWKELLEECTGVKCSTLDNNQQSNWREGTQYLRLDGSVSGHKRQELVNKFNRSPSCSLFLISTMAGNMGINLQAANRVIIFDASWNPANDLQAIFRSYRYGQIKKVFVYRLLSTGTIEERMYKKQVTKLNVSARVVDAQMPENPYTYREIESQMVSYDSDIEIGEECQRRTNELLRSDLVLHNSYAICSRFIKRIEDMDSLTMDHEEEHLNDSEKLEAEREFQLEISPPPIVPLSAVVAKSVLVSQNQS